MPPSGRKREVPLVKRLSLEQFVALMMPSPNLTIGKPNVSKSNTQPTDTSFNSHVTATSSVMPFDGITGPDKSGEAFF